MSEATYRTIVRHYEACLERHGDSHLGVDWPNAEDAAVRHDVMLDVVRPSDRGGRVSLLDFGCGAGHLVEHLRDRGVDDIAYTGLDISERFVELCRDKFPDLTFLPLDVLEDPDALPTFDYVVMNGVFTVKREVDHDRMLDYLENTVRTVFARTRVGLAFNVMSAHVDWTRDDLFHVPFDRLAAFLRRDVSRHYVFRADYGLYEYTAYVYRDPDLHGGNR